MLNCAVNGMAPIHWLMQCRDCNVVGLEGKEEMVEMVLPPDSLYFGSGSVTGMILHMRYPNGNKIFPRAVCL